MSHAVGWGVGGTKSWAQQKKMAKKWALLVLFMVLAVGLLGASVSDGSATPSEAHARFGVAGGILHGPDGIEIHIPANALTTEARIQVARGGRVAPKLPPQWSAMTAVYDITPHVEPFNLPVDLSVPFDVTTKSANTQVALAIASPEGGWELLPTVVTDGVAKSATTHFSRVMVVQLVEAFSTVELMSSVPVQHSPFHVLHVTAPLSLELIAKSHTLPGWENYCATVSHRLRVTRWGRVGSTEWAAMQVLQDTTQTALATDGTTTQFKLAIDATHNGLLELTFNSNCLELVHPIAGSPGPTVGGSGKVATVYVDIPQSAAMHTATRQTVHLSAASSRSKTEAHS
jgi:hypothetical protein